MPKLILLGSHSDNTHSEVTVFLDEMLLSGEKALTFDHLLHWATVRMRQWLGTYLYLSDEAVTWYLSAPVYWENMAVTWHLSLPVYCEDDTVASNLSVPFYCEDDTVAVRTCLPTYTVAHHVTQTNQNVPNQTLVYVRQKTPCNQRSITPVNAWASKAIATHVLDRGGWSFSYLPLYHLERAHGTVQAWSWVRPRTNTNDAEERQISYLWPSLHFILPVAQSTRLYSLDSNVPLAS